MATGNATASIARGFAFLSAGRALLCMGRCQFSRPGAWGWYQKDHVFLVPRWIVESRRGPKRPQVGFCRAVPSRLSTNPPVRREARPGYRMAHFPLAQSHRRLSAGRSSAAGISCRAPCASGRKRRVTTTRLVGSRVFLPQLVGSRAFLPAARRQPCFSASEPLRLPP